MPVTVNNNDVPARIRERKAFTTPQHSIEGFNDALGNYIVRSYYKPVVRVRPDGRVDRTKAHVYAGHMQLIEDGLREESS